MAHYDDWVYERGLEDEDWVHDRWGDDDDDWDDGWDDYETEEKSEGEENMDSNRISFAKKYSDSEKFVIKTKLDRIAKELKDLEIGPSAFKLNNEIFIIVDCDKKEKVSFDFKYRDDSDDSSVNYYDGVSYYSAASLFLRKWEDIKKEILEEKENFEKNEGEVFEITFTREDGIDTIFNAIKNGFDIDISSYLELPDLTKDEIKSFIQHGYGYDVYFQQGIHCEIQEDILRELFNRSYSFSGDKNTLDKWIEENPDKCLRPENRKR